MPTREELIDQGATPTIDVDTDAREVKVRKLPSGRKTKRPQVSLSDEQEAEVKKLLGNIWKEWLQNTSLLRSKLARANNIMEGIKEPKNFPWAGSSNLHVPVIEIHISTLHSVASSTMLEMDPIWYVKPIQERIAEDVDTDIEAFLHSKSKVEIKVDQYLSDIFWKAYCDGTGIGVLDWVQEYGKQYDSQRYETIEDFQKDFPSPDAAGISDEQYKTILADLARDQAVDLMVEEILSTYSGPKIRIVELKDLIVVPTTSPDVDYAMFIGDAFMERADFFKRMADNDGWFKKDSVEELVKSSGKTDAPDAVAAAQDNIEGIGRSRITKPDEYLCMQGLLKMDLDNDGIEEKFLVVYHPEKNLLLRMERFPYWHNRCNYILWRFKRRPKRLLGQSVYDQLIDINDEIDTQHNQRIDSRTITLVPSFLKTDTSDFDPTRKDQRFYPGVTFKVSNFNQLKQFDIKQTDMGQSLQEEGNLFDLADKRTGASQLKSGGETKMDPRSPAKKVQLLLAQSGQRIDDHMRELRVGTEELGYQILELYYQFSPDSISYPKFNPDTQQFVQAQIKRAKLRNRNVMLQVARTSIMDNPSQVVQRLMTVAQLVLKEPLVAGNLLRRREVFYRLLTALRERDVEKIIPKVPQLLQEIQQQSGPAGIQSLMQQIGAVQPPEGGDKDNGTIKPIQTNGNGMVG